MVPRCGFFVDPCRAKLYLSHDLASQHFNRSTLERVESARFIVYDAERTDWLPRLDPQGITGVEANEGRAEDERVLSEVRSFCRVFHDEEAVLSDRVGAEGHADRSFGRFQSDAGLEPLSLIFDEAHETNGGLTDVSGQLYELVKQLFWRSIEQLRCPKCL